MSSPPVAAGLLDDARALGPALREIRSDLHRNPELSWQEVRTTEQVAARLKSLGLVVEPFADMTGLTADVVLGPGPTIALRADLDALPIDDLSGGPDASTVPSVSHSCGHDVHTTALLGAAELLVNRAGRGQGTVRLVFQPAEEAIPGGAPQVLRTGRLDQVAAIAALHCDPSLMVGRFAVRPGPITSAADRLHFTLRGDGGHTARPHLTHDLVNLIARLAVELPARALEALEWLGEVSIVFGHLQAGDAPNVIPHHAVLEGTLRTRSKAVWDAAPDAVRVAAAELLEPEGVAWEFTHERGNPPVVNDKDVTIAARSALVDLVGDAHVDAAEQSLGSEDFSWYLESVPGTYVRLGVAPGIDPAPDLHSGDFDVHPDAMVFGAAGLASIALQLLER
jgi:amidohydrolase